MKFKCLEKSDKYSDFTEEELREITFEVEGERYLWHDWFGQQSVERYLKNLNTHKVVDMMTNVDDLDGVFQVFKHLMSIWEDYYGNNGNYLWEVLEEGYVIDTSKWDISDYSIAPFKIEGAIIKQ